MDTMARTVDGNEIILRAHDPAVATTLLPEVQLYHARRGLESAPRDHLISMVEGKDTQLLYLRQVDGKGEIIDTIPFIQRAGLMTCDHWKPESLDYQRNVPFVALRLDTKWDPQGYYNR
jgi:hypothetical protein